MTATATHVRIVNGGTQQLIPTREALDEMNAATIGNLRKEVRQMYANGDRAHIEYRDGRTVDLRPATEADLPSAEPANAKPTNLRTHTGTVHAPGRYSKRLRTNIPACCVSESAVARFHYVIPTSDPVTCQRCPAPAA